MRISEFAVLFGVFMLVFFSANSFLHAFNLQQTLPNDIQTAWNESYEQVEKARKTVTEKVEKLSKSEGLVDTIVNTLASAFGMIQYIALSLWTVFVSIPSEIFGAFRFLASTFGIDPMVVTILTSIITVILIIKLIEFLTGRHGL